jgi:hypothetical protein
LGGGKEGGVKAAVLANWAFAAQHCTGGKKKKRGIHERWPAGGLEFESRPVRLGGLIGRDSVLCGPQCLWRCRVMKLQVGGGMYRAMYVLGNWSKDTYLQYSVVSKMS